MNRRVDDESSLFRRDDGEVARSHAALAVAHGESESIGSARAAGWRVRNAARRDVGLRESRGRRAAQSEHAFGRRCGLQELTNAQLVIDSPRWKRSSSH